MKRLTIFLIFVCAFSGQGRAAISDNSAARAIAGEAEGEGPRGMLGVACALRNRGTLKGVYGVNAPRVKEGKVSPEIMREAERAWQKSKKKDITKGADHWHNLKREGPRKWTKQFKKTAVIGQHVFYKSNRRQYIK